MRVAVLSPHRDDAAFSCGLTIAALLQAGSSVTIVNVCTRSDYAVDDRTLRAAATRTEAVSATRHLEDEACVRDLLYTTGRDEDALRLHDLAWLDAPLRLTVKTEQVLASPLTDVEVLAQANTLSAELSLLHAFDLIFAPLALGDHIDHRIVREAAKLLLPPDRVCWYEDLPYAARLLAAERNSASRLALPLNAKEDFHRCTLHLPEGPHLKKSLALHYPSQIAASVADEMAEYAARWSNGDAGAERWWATPVSSRRMREALAGGTAATLEEKQ